MIREPMKTTEARAPTDFVFHARNADALAARVRGPRRGWCSWEDCWFRGMD